MTIYKNGNVGIGNTNPGRCCHHGGRFRIRNGPADYTLIGIIDVHDAPNTRIVISGNSRPESYSGHIEYVATYGNHVFYTNGVNEKNE